MRLIEERRGSSVISYVYEPDSYVPLARLDALGEPTDQGGLGTTDDAALHPLPHAGEVWGEGQTTSETVANNRDSTPTQAANDAETRYWQSLHQEAERKAQALHIEGWATGADGPTPQTAQVKIAEVYYFHTDQVGLPEELSNAQGQLVWQASYQTWGNTASETWQATDLAGRAVHRLDEGDTPAQEAKQQNLRFQGQYLDRDTGLHYNTFRYYDPDIGRFISPDPIGLEGGINLGSYSPNPISWIDPWGWANGRMQGAEATASNGVDSVRLPNTLKGPHAEINALEGLRQGAGFEGKNVVLSDIEGRFPGGKQPVGMCTNCRANIFDVLIRGKAASVTIPKTVGGVLQGTITIMAKDFKAARDSVQSIINSESGKLARSNKAWAALEKFKC